MNHYFMSHFKKKDNSSKSITTNGQAIYNILSTTILSGINFVTIPLFTRLLGAEQYGLYSVFHSWVIIIMCFITLECRSGLGTARYVFKENYEEYKSSSLLLGLSAAMIFILISIVFRNQLSGIFGYSPSIVILIFICALAYHLVEFAKNAYIYEKKAQKNFVLSVSLAILTVTLSYFFLKTECFKEKFLARVFGDVLPYLIISAVFVILTLKKIPPKYNKEYWKYCFVMGFPIVFHGLSQDILKQSDRIMMQHMGYAGATLGVYSFFCTYTAIVNVVLTALNTTWCPFYYDDLNEKAYEKLKNKCKNYLELFTVVTCGFLLVSREMCYFFSNKEYWSGMNVIPVLVIGIYFIFMYQFPVNFEFFHKKTKIIAVGTFSAAIVNIILNMFLIPKSGMYGAALATAVSYGLLFVAHYVIAVNMRGVKFHMDLKNFIPGLIAVFIFSRLFYVADSFWIFRWILGISIGAFEMFKIIKRKRIF